MPWRHSGAQFKRTWPIAPDSETLKRRWRALLKSQDRALAFRETRDRKVIFSYPVLPGSNETGSLIKPIIEVPVNAPSPRIERYAYRSFDRQWILADSRLGDFLRPDLWRTQSDKQVFITSLLTTFLGAGPALTASADVPDLHYFSGRGQKDAIPLYRDSGSSPNIVPGLLDMLGKQFHRQVSPEDFLAYVYGVLAHSFFTSRFSKELETRELRVPITKEGELFEQVRSIGARLLWLHTYGERFVPKGKHRGNVPQGKAKCKSAVPEDTEHYPESFSYDTATQTLSVGEGRFSPVSIEVYDFEVSGLKVVHSWLKYRMKEGAGRTGSPLNEIHPDHWTDQFTTELLELLWVLEATVGGFAEQSKVLEAVLQSKLFEASEMPQVHEDLRKPPKSRDVDSDQLLFD
jgi:hypothetical protein